jgi:hypothetical protein
MGKADKTPMFSDRPTTSATEVKVSKLMLKSTGYEKLRITATVSILYDGGSRHPTLF